METNIDKEYFNKRFAEYMTIQDRQIENWFYTKYLHDQIKTIIHNVTYHWDFNSEQLLYEDIEADLLLHLQMKKAALAKYSGNWYNIIFTSFRNKFYDLLDSYKVSQDKIIKLLELTKDHLSLTYEMEYNEQEKEPEVLPIFTMENSPVLQAAG